MICRPPFTMASTPSPPPLRRTRVFLSSTPLLTLISVGKAGPLAIAELGLAAFFVMGIAHPALQSLTFWFVLAAAIASVFVRAIDIETWALFLPGGLIGRAEQAFGPRVARVTAAGFLAERFLFAALSSVVCGHYIAGIAASVVPIEQLGLHFTLEELSTVFAVALVGAIWIRMRMGIDLSRDTISRIVGASVTILAVLIGWGVLSSARVANAPLFVEVLRSPLSAAQSPADFLSLCLLGIALVLPVLGGGDGLAREAHNFPPPRVPALKRTARLVILFGVCAIVVPTLLFEVLVPGAEKRLWMDAPLTGLVQHFMGPAWLRALGNLALAAAAFLMLGPAAHAALNDAAQTLRRLSIAQVLPERVASLHPRFGTGARALDVSVTASVLVMLASSGRITWLARAYAVGLAITLLFKIVVLIRFRRTHPEGRPFKAPFNVTIGNREIPIGLIGAGTIVSTVMGTMLLRGDIPSITAAGLVLGLALLFTREQEERDAGQELDAFELLAPADLSLGQVEARPGNLLVPVRNPHALAHVTAAVQAPGDRDVIVMTVRLLDKDVTHEEATSDDPTPYERNLFSQVVAVAERYRRPVRLLIVPAHDVFEAVINSAIRLRSSEVFVGESVSLSADDQARLLGEAWEHADKPEACEVRLVIYHRSGRTDTYQLGAHAPTLTPRDLDLIHRVWLDATKAVGPHVHHHDVVRAALTKMEQQLAGPEREDALGMIRQIARPADELVAVLRARDYTRLRDMVRNRASDLAEILTDLSIEDQVVVFRVLPRKDAAAVFEYLSQDAKESLLKAMAHEEIAALLNNMAPDDRTMFLEELPAAATRQLLSLLTPAERSVALTLLGYPERSVGRLMTPHYVVVREGWTVREVLDYVREHGQDSETLNVIYVVDPQGLLIDDIRIREFLLTSLDSRVSDLMDRRFVALKATDDQQEAVATFRQYDRSALPVTDTAGMLIGIVTIDDVLDVAEAVATREIQKIGGSEALDEPYMEIGFGRMVQKRAGWLTALFLGELLTATAMGAFEAEISRAVVLALFVPLIISSGGNSGSQASTLVIRALALGELALRDWWRVMRREVLAGLSLGTILGSIGFLRITLWSAFSDIYGPHWLLVAITVALALIGIVLWGTLIGSLLPFLLRRLGFDPATSSAPFVATLVDVTGLVIYFSVATVVLRGTLL